MTVSTLMGEPAEGMADGKAVGDGVRRREDRGVIDERRRVDESDRGRGQAAAREMGANAHGVRRAVATNA